jgi:hypothetical protein
MPADRVAERSFRKLDQHLAVLHRSRSRSCEQHCGRSYEDMFNRSLGMDDKWKKGKRPGDLRYHVGDNRNHRVSCCWCHEYRSFKGASLTLMNLQVHNRHVSSQTTAPKKLEDSEFPDTYNGYKVTCSEGGTNQRVEVLKSIPRKERSLFAARKPPRPPRSETKAK